MWNGGGGHPVMDLSKFQYIANQNSLENYS